MPNRRMPSRRRKDAMAARPMEPAPQATEGEMPSATMGAGAGGGEMPRAGMNTAPAPGGMPTYGMTPTPAPSAMSGNGMNQPSPGGQVRVLVEIRVQRARGPAAALEMARGMNVSGFEVDPSYEPIPIRPGPGQEGLVRAANEEVMVVRGIIDERKIDDLKAQPNVLGVTVDRAIFQPFAAVAVPPDVLPREEPEPIVMPMEGFGPCPIGTCDCAPSVAKGTIADVAGYLGVDQIWAAGHRGDGIVVGVVDGGITAIGRTPAPGEVPRIPRVIGGYPADWGTTAAAWGDHGNMCATDVLGMAPNAQIYDIRISAGGIAATISAALAGFQWAITQHQTDGTPHILTNSWGIFQEAWEPSYARDPNHLFTRKVVDALDEGIIVLFAAGNCGGTCPDGRCGPDTGTGRSIWGANGHPRVITVGAVNTLDQFVGYSSQGPAALDPRKPDFCSVTHFQGYFPSDSGTSAATPIAAGVVALLKQANLALTQDQAKTALLDTARDIGPPGWDQHSGAGIIQGKAAYDRVAVRTAWSGWENLGGYCISAPTVASWAANRLDTFVLGGDHALYHKWWDGVAWSGWEYQGGYCLDSPAAVSWGPNRIDTFVIGLDHALYHKWWDGVAWSGWEYQGGFCRHGVGAASWAANRLDVFVIGGDHALYHKWWDGVAWSGWENLGGFCISAPAAVSWGPNRIDVFVIGGDNALYHKWWDGAAWSGWENLGGFCISAPTVASWDANRLDVFVIGGDNALYHKWWDGVAWSGWENLGGVCISAPGAVSWGPNRIDTFVIGTDNAMYHKWYG